MGHLLYLEAEKRKSPSAYWVIMCIEFQGEENIKNASRVPHFGPFFSSFTW